MASSVDIDELIASLSNNHIGQHHMDIAKVREQLAQLLYWNGTHAQQASAHQQQHTTPTTRTSMPANWLPEPRKRSSSLATSPSDGVISEEDEVERMMECVPEEPTALSLSLAFAAATASGPFMPPPNSPQRTAAPAFFPGPAQHQQQQQQSQPQFEPFFAAPAPPSFFGHPGERPPLTIDTLRAVQVQERHADGF